MEPIIGQIMEIGFTYAPQGWALCNGQILSISQYTALFSLLGTTYGGDGRTTFALPNLQSRVSVGQGAGIGLSNYAMGQTGGAENVTLLSGQLPFHGHNGGLSTTAAAGTTNNPTNASPATATDSDRNPINFYGPSDGTTSIPVSTQNTGGNAPHPNIQPVLAVYYVIALQGIYPSRP